ncbi:MAG: SMI1/KNR4 family protein [Clostridia bacterium]|nr:SMI1/KNR4 family protein [Clostridia bacterium]
MKKFKMKTPYGKKIIACVAGCIISAAVLIAAIAFIYEGVRVPKIITLLMFFGGPVGVCMCIALTVKFTFLLKEQKKEQPSFPPYVKVDRKQKFTFRPQSKEEDAIRIPLEYDDEEGQDELEKHTEKFLETLAYPAGFEEFLTEFQAGETDKRFFINERREYDADPEYYEIGDIYPLEEIKQLNMDFLVFCDDYHTQFRDILMFADDKSGHCHFFLDYGRGGEPKVKYLDDEFDLIVQLANSFEEFVNNLVAEEAAKKI